MPIKLPDHIPIPSKRLHESISGGKLTDSFRLMPFSVQGLEFHDIAELAPALASEARGMLAAFMDSVPRNVRCSEGDCKAFNVGSIVLAVFRNGQLYGAWNLFNITKTEETDGDVQVSSFFVSALPGIGTPEWDSQVKLVLNNLLNRPLPTREGRSLTITEWKVPSITGTSNPLTDWDSSVDLEKIREGTD